MPQGDKGKVKVEAAPEVEVIDEPEVVEVEEDRYPTPEETERDQAALREAMAEEKVEAAVAAEYRAPRRVVHSDCKGVGCDGCVNGVVTVE